MNEDIYCTTCPPVMVGKNKDRRADPPLDLVVRNYSGTGVDIFQCATCGKRFQVSYKIDKVIEIK